MQNDSQEQNLMEFNKLVEKNLALTYIFKQLYANPSFRLTSDNESFKSAQFFDEHIANYKRTLNKLELAMLTESQLQAIWFNQTRSFLGKVIASEKSSLTRSHYKAYLNLMEQDLGLNPQSTFSKTIDVVGEVANNFAQGAFSGFIVASSLGCWLAGTLLAANLAVAVTLPPVGVVIAAYLVLAISFSVVYGSMAALMVGAINAAVQTPLTGLLRSSGKIKLQSAVWVV